MPWRSRVPVTSTTVAYARMLTFILGSDQPATTAYGFDKGGTLEPDRCLAVVRRPRVSVAIASYNYGRYLGDCVRSALSQEGVNLEVVIVDDASTDNSVAVASALAAEDDRVRLITHRKNAGHIATFNESLSTCSGEYVVKLDSDDMLTPGSLVRSAALLDAHPNVGLVYGFPVTFTDALPLTSNRVRSWKVWKGSDWISIVCRRGRNCIMQPEAVVRTAVLRCVGLHRADCPQTHDMNLWLRIAATSDVGRINGPGQGYYRIHDASLLRTRFAGMLTDLTERRRAFDLFFEEVDGHSVGQWRRVAHRELAREALGHAISAYARGAVDLEPVDGYIGFATETFPDARGLREWRALQRRRRRGKDHIDRSARGRELMRDLKYRWQWRRWRWSGV